MKISIPAWQDGRYLSLAELLRLIRNFVVSFNWSLNIVEMAPEPGAEQVMQLFDHPLNTAMLLDLVSPDLQIVDGEVVGESRDSTAKFVLRAVDSTSWDIETEMEDAISHIFRLFPTAREIKD